MLEKKIEGIFVLGYCLFLKALSENSSLVATDKINNFVIVPSFYPAYKIELELGMLFGGRTFRAKTGANNKVHPHMTPGQGIRSAPHWWKDSVLITVPLLLP